MKTLITIFFLIIGLGNSAVGFCEMYPFYSMGGGYGQSAVSGDYLKSDRGSAFSMGIESEFPRWLFAFEGSANIDNKFNSGKLLFGYGRPSFKIATGFIGHGVNVPTEDTYAGTAGADNLDIDTSRETEVSVTSIPLYLRWTPFRGEAFVLSIDGFYGLYAIGSMDIPVRVLGQPATVSTDPEKQGGNKGISVSAIWKLPKVDNVAIKFVYRYAESDMDSRTSAFKNDPLGLLGTATTPDVNFQSEVLLLSVVFVSDFH
jgi:hypothetical protein